ncbi:MAG: homoserine O-acetyltransferase [Deltaproteobacteria bacterium]|nr:homoserine O-acetyltransferase [Deltaproteobacteria bacterium]
MKPQFPPGSVGFVEPKSFTFAEPPHEMQLDFGGKLGPVTIAYETYGRLNRDRSNAVLVLHAFSGSAHAAGYHEGQAPGKDKPGWWDFLIGPGRALDTEKYFVLCSNVIGSCYGSTGPSSIDPKTGRPYGLSFPIVTIGDMVRAQRRLVDHLGIRKLLSVIGGSMGGMQVLQWAIDFPDRVASAVPIATTARHSPQQIAFNHVGRAAILSDRAFHAGDYYDQGTVPERGLSVARMVGFITYLSDRKMQEKFGRSRQHRPKASGKPQKWDPWTLGYHSAVEFQVESYLKHQGDIFVFDRKFDANSYLSITKAIDIFDIAGPSGSLAAAFSGATGKFLIVSFDTDWLYPTYQSQEIRNALMRNGLSVTCLELETIHGHDAFLLEYEEPPEGAKPGVRNKLAGVVRDFLGNVERDG